MKNLISAKIKTFFHIFKFFTIFLLQFQSILQHCFKTMFYNMFILKEILKIIQLLYQLIYITIFAPKFKNDR